MEESTTTVRRRTGFSDLPAELTGMILEHLISDIDIDDPRDLRRWNRYDTSTSRTPNNAAPNSHSDYSNTNSFLGQQIRNQVRVSVRPHLQEGSQQQAGIITVAVPRRWKELLISGLFRDRDLSWFGRKMTIDVVYLGTRRINNIISRADNRTEATVRALLARLELIRVYDLRLHNIRFSSANLSCYLSQLRSIDVFHEGMTPWPRRNADITALDVNLHVITEKEVYMLQSTGTLPDDLEPMLNARDSALEYLEIWVPLTQLSVRGIRRRILLSEWTGDTTHCVRLNCIVQGSSDWSNHRNACLALIVDIKGKYLWDLVGAGINPDVGQSFGVHLWASRLHFDL